MKKTYFALGLFFLAIVIVSAFAPQDKISNDLANCVKKTRSEFCVKCPTCSDNLNTYKVYFVNICKDTLDIKISVQNKNKTWKIFEKQDFRPNDSISAFSCDGTGKFLKWAKKSSDRTKKSVVK